MIDQRNKQVTFKSAFGDFFRGFVDFKGYTTRTGHWFPLGTITGGLFVIIAIFFSSIISSFLGISSRANSDLSYALSGRALNSATNTAAFTLVGLFIIIIISIVLAIPVTASYARRLRDAGFANGGITVAIVLAYILNFYTVYLISPVYLIAFFFVLMSLPSNSAETNSNSELARFFFRQTPQAAQYFAQFNNQFGQTYYQGQPNGQYGQGHYQGGQPNGQYGQGHYQGGQSNGQYGQGHYQGGQPNGQYGQGHYQGGQPNGQYGQGHYQGGQPNFQNGQPNRPQQNINPNGQRPAQPNAPQQNFNPNGQRPAQPNAPQQNFNPNGQRPAQPNAPQQNFSPNGQRPVQPNAPQQNFNPNGQRPAQPNAPQQNFNPNGQRPVQPNAPQQNFNPNGQRPAQSNAPVEEVAPEKVETVVEKTQEPKKDFSAKSKRLQKLNKQEDEVIYRRRR